MRMVDWITVCFAVAAVIGLASGLVISGFGALLVSGAAATEGVDIVFSASSRVIGFFSLGMAVGCFLAAGYCAHVLREKYHDWRQWLRFKPPRSYWDVAEEAEEKRKR